MVYFGDFHEYTFIFVVIMDYFIPVTQIYSCLLQNKEMFNIK